MPQQVIKTRNARTIRVTDMGDCCTLPVSGQACALTVFDAFTTFSASVNSEDGLVAFERKANGDVCINERESAFLTHMSLSLTLCNLRPEDISMLTGWPVTRDIGGRAVGFDIMEGAPNQRTAVELWSSVSGATCVTGQRHGYAVFPCTTGWTLDGEIEWAGLDTIQQITLVAETNGQHVWGKGPYNVQDANGDGTGSPDNLRDPIPTGAHARIMATTVPPPALTDGCVAATAANGFLYPTGT